jgi:hypothetical protein
MRCTINVNGLSGPLCSFGVRFPTSTNVVKKRIEAALNIPCSEQILVYDEQKRLTDCQSLPMPVNRGSIDLTLIRRDPFTASWVKAMSECGMVEFLKKWKADSGAENNADLILDIMRGYPFNINYVMMAVTLKKLAAQELWSDRDFVLAAVELTPCSYELAADCFFADEEFVLAVLDSFGDKMAICQFSEFFRRVSKDLLKRSGILQAAAQKTAWILPLESLAESRQGVSTQSRQTNMQILVHKHSFPISKMRDSSCDSDKLCENSATELMPWVDGNECFLTSPEVALEEKADRDRRRVARLRKARQHHEGRDEQRKWRRKRLADCRSTPSRGCGWKGRTVDFVNESCLFSRLRRK